jgi:predicted ArsR family transcriptional regulator
MYKPSEPPDSDRALLDLLRRRGPLGIAELSAAMGVTPTAVRNRLARLIGAGLVERTAERAGRGRPRHAYRASDEAQRRLGQGYADLAVALWEELMRSVADRRLRREVFRRVTNRLADLYRARLSGDRWEGRLEQLGTLLHERGIEAEVVESGGLPVLRQYSCPYFDLAESDDMVCALERKMFEKVVGHGLRLSTCRLDGDRACQFEAKPGTPPPARAV